MHECDGGHEKRLARIVLAMVDNNDAGVQEAIARGVIVPQEIENTAPSPQIREQRSAAGGGIVLAATRLIAAQGAAAHAERTSHVIRNTSANAGAHKTGHGGSAAIVVATLCTVLGNDAVADGERIGSYIGAALS